MAATARRDAMEEVDGSTEKHREHRTCGVEEWRPRQEHLGTARLEAPLRLAYDLVL